MGGSGPRPVRAVLRYVGSVLMVSGSLLIADAGVTLAWQEPVSAFMAEQEQRELERELEDPPARVLRKQPLKGDSIGRIVIPKIDKTTYMIEGTDTKTLRKGPGHYPKTPLPGEHGTVAVAGHRTTYGAPFRKVDKLGRGNRVIVEMPYGTFTYRVQKVDIVDDSELSVIRKVGYNRLVLTACHPLYSAAQRIVVFARLIDRGPARVAD